MAINTAIDADSDYANYQMNVNLYRYLRKIRIEAKAIYITRLNDDFSILTVYDGRMLYSASIENHRIDNMHNSGANVYEFSVDMPIMYDMSGSQAIGRAELIIKVTKNTIIKEYTESQQ